MNDYKTLLQVTPLSEKSKYPFTVMNELEIKKTYKTIELELVDAHRAARREAIKNMKRIRGGGCDPRIQIIFISF